MEMNLRGEFLISSARGLFSLEGDALYRLRKGNHYGITKHGNAVFVYENAGFRGRIIRLTYDAESGIVATGSVWRNDLPKGCHQIDCVGDFLFVTDTYNNRVIRYNFRSSHFDEFYPLGRLDNGRSSRNYGHINSIFKPNGEGSYYLYCHNETVKTNRKSQIIVVDEEFNIISTIDTDAVSGHNIVKFGDRLFYCDSGGRCLVCNGRPVFKTEHLPRGLSITEDFIVVGESEFKERHDRKKSSGNLFVLSHDFEVLYSIPFPGPVQEIRRMDGEDYGMSNYCG